MQYSESDLTFIFPPPWQVVAFDKHRFYQYVNGHGLRGVDFIGVHPEFGCFLMEVKNYRLRFGDDLPAQVKSYLHNPALLAPVLEAKFHDSLRLLDAVKIYLERKWWYRLGRKQSWFRKLFVSKESRFWMDFYSSYEEKPVHLWVCLDAEARDYPTFKKAWVASGLSSLLSRPFPGSKVDVFSSYEAEFQQQFFFKIKANT
jgi:hypothetical protein